MCKILTLTNMTKIKEIKPVIQYICQSLTKTEPDGFGYAIQGVNGVFGEITLEPDIFQPSNFKFSPPNFVVSSSDSFGQPSTVLGPALFHGRTSTNSVSLNNTHPLQKHGWTLIHNGVVTNHGETYQAITSNDTEHILEHLAKRGIDYVTENLTGYYAVAALDPAGNLHIFRDKIAKLYYAYIESIDSHVFATTPELILDLCNRFKWIVTTPYLMKDDTYLIYGGNDLLNMREIKSRGHGYSEAKWMSKSLGHDYSYYSSDDYNYNSVTDIEVARYLREKESEAPKDLTLNDICNMLTENDSIFDKNGKKIALSDFDRMHPFSQAQCIIKTSDGQTLDLADFYLKTRA